MPSFWIGILMILALLGGEGLHDRVGADRVGKDAADYLTWLADAGDTNPVRPLMSLRTVAPPLLRRALQSGRADMLATKTK